MATDRFETIPAWRIARLRAALADAERRGALPSDDDGSDLDHPALRRRFALGRARRGAAAAANARTTRKGRRFPATKQRLIWRAILAHRPAGWRSGDKAPRGSISQAHREAAAACRAAGLPAPRYRTIQVLWHRGAPPPAILSEIGPAPATDGRDRS